MLRLQLISLSGVKFDGDVAGVTLPTVDGEISVLPYHMPLITVASHGSVAVRQKPHDADDAREFFALSGGVIEVENNVLRVLADEVDHADSINEAEVRAAIEYAKKLKEEATTQHDLEHAQQLIDRHTVRLQVAGLKRHPRR